MDEAKESPNYSYQSLCSECQTGVMRLKAVTYFTWLNNELVTAPNFPAWVCDVCGRREYDAHAILRLNTILTHEAGRKKGPRRRPSAPHVDQPPT